MLNQIDNLHWYCDSCLPHSFNTVASAFTAGAKYIDEVKIILDTMKDMTNSRVNPVEIASNIVAETVESPILTVHNDVTHHDVIDYEQMETLVDNQIEVGSVSNSSRVFIDETSTSAQNVDVNRKRSRSLSPSLMGNENKKVRDVQSVIPVLAPKQNAPNAGSSTELDDFVFVNSSPAANTNISRDCVISARKNIKSVNDKVRHNYRSVYVTRFNRTAKVSNIMGHLTRFDALKDSIGQITCTRLAPRFGKCSFVSFKIDVPEQCFDVVTKSDLWPSGITATEFVQRSCPRQQQIPANFISQPSTSQTVRHTESKNGHRPILNDENNRALHRRAPRGPRAAPRQQQHQQYQPHQSQRQYRQTQQQQTQQPASADRLNPFRAQPNCNCNNISSNNIRSINTSSHNICNRRAVRPELGRFVTRNNWRY